MPMEPERTAVESCSNLECGEVRVKETGILKTKDLEKMPLKQILDAFSLDLFPNLVKQILWNRMNTFNSDDSCAIAR